MDDQALLRYSRQIMLPEIDAWGQERLAAAHALIIGLGGLGSPAAMYLAAAGLGRLTLVDHDRVELSNLQRQIIHATADIGRHKVESAARTLTELNPLVAVGTVDHALEGEALTEAVRAADVVLDCSDNLTTRLALNAACVRERRTLVAGAAIRWEGQLMVVRPDRPEAPCYRCLYRSEEETAETCAQSGVLSPLLGVIGSLQAVEAIKQVLGIGDGPVGRLLLFDALRLEWQAVDLPKNPQCPVCAVRDR
ncbi:MAG: molybdopterin-synthase adenylyltransferase MoeB [Candidatus Competibacterales bacterium]|nr:molybdopterin-synthase adenylyltransferase MoeB [Candidatus Competibacterales bacterium]